MAVERLTDYTRRIWTALDADAPEGHDFEVGDVIYYMDSSQCGIVTYVYPEGSIDVEFLPDIGGGGGGGGDYQSGSFVLASASKTFTVPLDGPINNFLFYTDSFPDYPDGLTGWLTIGGMWRSSTSMATLQRYSAGQSGVGLANNTATATGTEIRCTVVNYNLPAGVNINWLGW